MSATGTPSQPDRRVNSWARSVSRRMTSQSTLTVEHPLVVGEDAARGVEDAAALGHQPHRLGLAGVDGLLQRLRLHRLQEPQPHPHRAEQQRGDDGEHAESGGALVSRHGDQSAPRRRRSRGSHRSVTRSSRGAFHSGSLTRMHQRPTGTSTALITAAPTPTTTDDDDRSAASNGCSSPMNARITGTSASPTAAPSPVKIAASHHGGRTVIDDARSRPRSRRCPSRSTTSRAACRR